MIQLFYGVIESVDVFTAILIAIGVIPNIYSLFFSTSTEIGMLMDTMPWIFVLIFFFFASLRILSGYWILVNRKKGFWLALLVTGISLLAVWFMLPLSALDLCILLPVIVLLLNGYFGESTIIQKSR